MAHENRGLPILSSHGGSFHGELLNDQMDFEKFWSNFTYGYIEDGTLMIS
jgi:hypothetical protein